jgi:Uma2 family endonuclease
MPTLIEESSAQWTVDDLRRRFGPILLSRIRFSPAPGTAVEDDVVQIHERERRLCELVDGTLVEKTMGSWESSIAAELIRLLGNYNAETRRGVVLSSDGMVRLAPGLIRIPDVSFISWDRLRGRRLPDQAVLTSVPDLAVEILSRGNTEEEMTGKLHHYLDAGVRLVWYIDPRAEIARIYRGSLDAEIITIDQSIDGGDILPGFTLPLRELLKNPVSPEG